MDDTKTSHNNSCLPLHTRTHALTCTHSRVRRCLTGL